MWQEFVSGNWKYWSNASALNNRLFIYVCVYIYIYIFVFTGRGSAKYELLRGILHGKKVWETVLQVITNNITVFCCSRPKRPAVRHMEEQSPPAVPYSLQVETARLSQSHLPTHSAIAEDGALAGRHYTWSRYSQIFTKGEKSLPAS